MRGAGSTYAHGRGGRGNARSCIVWQLCAWCWHTVRPQLFRGCVPRCGRVSSSGGGASGRPPAATATPAHGHVQAPSPSPTLPRSSTGPAPGSRSQDLCGVGWWRGSTYKWSWTPGPASPRQGEASRGGESRGEESREEESKRRTGREGANLKISSLVFNRHVIPSMVEEEH